MKSNVYWPIYKNIEGEFNRLMFDIHIDDNQLCVYSSKISDLILRAAAEIESLSKELYLISGGPKRTKIKYDEDALAFLNSKWRIENKTVIISSYNCFVSEKELKPFMKNEKRTGSGYLTYSWNNAYQNLKHDRAKSLKFGSVKYLFDVTAALFLLNIYYNDLQFDLGKDNLATKFDDSLGSSIYAIKLHNSGVINADILYTKNPNFDECTYLLKITDETYLPAQQVVKKINDELSQLANQQAADAIRNISLGAPIEEGVNTALCSHVIESYREISIRKLAMANVSAFQQMQYEAVLNKNQF